MPFVTPDTYERLIERLSDSQMVVLGFTPDDKKKYGVLEIDGTGVQKLPNGNIGKTIRLKNRPVFLCAIPVSTQSGKQP